MTSNMTVSDAISKAYLQATGKTTSLQTTDSKYQRLLGIADMKQKEWQNQPGVDWNSLYQLFTLSAKVTATDTYALDPTSLRKISQREGDSIRISRLDGNTDYYDLISPYKLLEYDERMAAAVMGDNLVFSKAFQTDDPQIGGTIIVPGYGFVVGITGASSAINVDDPMWLVYAMAAEYVRNDQVRQNQYPNLVALANNVMQGMIEANGDQLEEIPIDINLIDLDPNQASGAWV